VTLASGSQTNEEKARELEVMSHVISDRVLHCSILVVRGLRPTAPPRPATTIGLQSTTDQV
jgi:hypothetical protein